jgi:hypothetical protein
MGKKYYLCNMDIPVRLRRRYLELDEKMDDILSKTLFHTHKEMFIHSACSNMSHWVTVNYDSPRVQDEYKIKWDNNTNMMKRMFRTKIIRYWEEQVEKVKI